MAKLIPLHQPSPGIWDLVTDIMATTDTNHTECMCSDLQTDDYSPLYAWYNYLLIIVALPTLSVFGVCTNIINIFIYSRRRMRTSANTYLLFLACSDFLVILTGLFIFWIDSARSYIPELARAPYTTVYTLPFGYMAQTCSIYFTVAAAFDCFVNTVVSVCCKRHAASYCSIRKAKQICYSIVVLSILYNSLRFPQFNLRKCYHKGSQETIIEICPTTLFFTINIVYNVYMYMVLMTLLPFLFLLILNAFIVCRQSLDHVLVNPQENDERVDDGAAKGDDTITMIMVVVLFLACNTLALFVNLFETFCDPDPLLLNLLSDASNFLVIFNSSVNCVIYYIFNKDYREVALIHARRIKNVIKEQYCCCCCFSSSSPATYQPVTVIQQKAARPSIQNGGIKERPSQRMANSEFYASPDSPVWQPLTSRNLPGLEGWNGTEDAFTYDSQSEICRTRTTPLDEDQDSGWGDAVSNRETLNGRNPERRWLAEVKIVDGIRSERPHIVVKPLSDRECLSITAL